MNDTLAIRQVYYGSNTGRSNYQILCASPGVSDETLRMVDQHANLGGSALAGAQPDPIHAFYKLGQGQMAYAVTGFPSAEMGPRGNDYLVHALILNEEVLSLLKGQIFLLSHFFQTQKKPEKNQLLNPILISRSEYEAKALSPGNTWLKPGFSDEFLAFLLTRLSMGPVAALSKKPEQNMALCRSLFALLTPDDRMNFSFCTHFSYNRHLNYKFVLFPEQDRDLAERYQSRGSAIIEKLSWPENSEMNKDRMLRWIERVRDDMEPLFGFSLLSGVRDALELDQALTAVNGWMGKDGGESPLNRLDPKVRELLLKIGRDRYNRNTPRVAPIFELCILESFRDRVERHLSSQDNCLAAIRKDALNIARVIEADALWVATKGRVLVRSGGVTPSTTASMMALGLYLPKDPELKHIYHPSIKETLFHGPAEAAELLMALALANGQVTEGLLATWLALWFEKVPGGDFESWSRIIQAVGGRFPKRKDFFWELFLSSCQLAVKDRDQETRHQFLGSLIHNLWPRIPKVFTKDNVIQLTVDGDLLRGLSHKIVKEIMAPLLKRHLEYLSHSLKRDPVFLYEQLYVLWEMMRRMTAMLNLNNRRYPNKKPVVRPYWEMVIQILHSARASMEAHKGGEMDQFAKDTLFLLWAASQNMALDRILRDNSTSRFAKELSEILYYLVTHFPELNRGHMVHIVRHLTGSATPEEVRLLRTCLGRLKEHKEYVNNLKQNKAFLERLLVEVRGALTSDRLQGRRSPGRSRK